MINYVSKKELERIYINDIKAFVKNNLSDNEYIVISKTPIEINNVRFRISMFYTDDNLKKATLVAAEKQNSKKFIGRTSQEVHEMWLKSWAGYSYISELYGIRYEFDDASIVSEHDPRSGSDVIVVKYTS